MQIAYSILRAVMFADFMARLFCSRARRENRRIASYVTVFATPLSDKIARQKAANVAARSIRTAKNHQCNERQNPA